VPVFFFDIPIAGHTEFVSENLYIKTLGLLVFFFVILNLFLKKRALEKLLIRKSLKKIRSWPIFLFFYLIQILIIASAIIKGSVVIGIEDSYSAYTENIDNQSGTWEYFYLVYMLCFLFSTMRFTKALMIISFILYCYVSITRGYRIQMIQMTILFFILYLDGLFKNMYLVLGLIFGLLSMEVLGVLKMIGGRDTSKIMDTLSGFDNFLLTTQTEVFYSTTAVLGLVEKNVIGLQIQAETFIGFLINIIAPSGLMWNGSRLLDHISKYAGIGGGGYCFGYTYFWMGYLGIILLALYIGWLLNSILSKNNLLLLVIILTISVCPRWFAYEPANYLFRLEIWLVIMYSFILLFLKKPHEQQAPTVNN
jgi:hypothetical protein